jgi:hypothetical protein
MMKRILTILLLLICTQLLAQEPGMNRRGARTIGAGVGIVRATASVDTVSIHYIHSGVTTNYATIASINALSMSAGDSVLFKKGKTWRERLVPPTSGTAANPIVFGSYGSGAKPIINGSTVTTGWTLYSGAIYYAVIANAPTVVVQDDTLLKFWAWTTNVATTFATAAAGSFSANGDTAFVWTTLGNSPNSHTMQVSSSADNHTGCGIYAHNLSYVIIDGLTVCNSATQGIYFLEETTESNITIQNCTVFNTGTSGIQLGGPADATMSRNNLFDKDTVYHCQQHGLGFFYHVHNSTVSNCLSYENSCTAPLGYHGITAWSDNATSAPDSITIDHNTVYRTGMISSSVVSTDGAGIQCDNNAKDCVVRYNLSYSNYGAGLYSNGGVNNTFYYNIAYHNVGGGVITTPNAAFTVTIENNVIYGNYLYGIEMDAAHTGSTIKNNILCDNTTYEMKIYNNGAADVINNNLVYHAAGGNFMRWDWDPETWAVWKSTSAQDASSVNANPVFTDSAAHTFTLQSTSPALDIGANVGLTVDYAGNPTVPISVVGYPDAGAYEYQGVTQYKLTVTTGANGTISPADSFYVRSGGLKRFVVTPTAGYSVDSIAIDGVKVDSTAGYTFTGVVATHTIAAAFKLVPVAFSDSSGSNSETAATTNTWTHTIAGNYLVVCVNTGGSGNNVDSIKVWTGAGAKTKLTGVVTTGYTRLYGTVAPPIGLDTIQVWLGGSYAVIGLSASYSNVNQTTPTGTVVVNAATSTTPTDTVVATSTSDRVVGFIANASKKLFTPTATGMVRRIELNHTNAPYGAMQLDDMPGINGSVVLAGTLASTAWRYVGVALKP